jgi:cardiolipin synthase
MDHIATWLVFLVVFRDFMIIGGAILYHTLTQSLRMEPLFISKFNTVTQITFAGVVLGELGLGVGLSVLSQVLAYIVALTTFVSGAAYVYKWGWLAVLMERDR